MSVLVMIEIKDEIVILIMDDGKVNVINLFMFEVFNVCFD